MRLGKEHWGTGKLGPYFLVMLFAVQTPVLNAQNPDKPAPSFTLTLSVPQRDGTMVPYQQVLLATYTNISKGVAYESYCGAFGALYQLVVTYNGVPVKESVEAQRRRKIAESGRCFGGTGSNPGRNLQPGQSRQDHLAYNTFKPGMYGFTVEQNTFPLNPSKNVTVRSNTVAIVVPAAASTRDTTPP